MMKMRTRSAQSGFSLLELLVAMAVTLVITGAMYGLLSSGQSAFKREPALTDRQQNIRVAMDLIQQDLGKGGMNMGAFFQTFTTGLNGVGPEAPNGKADELEIAGNDGTCPDAPADPANPTNGSNINTQAAIPNCYKDDQFVIVIYGNGNAKWGFGHEIHAQNQMINFPPGQQPNGSQITSVEDLGSYCSTCAPPDNSTPVALGYLEIIRYAIANDTDGTPGLWRTTLGGWSGIGSNSPTYVPAPDPDGGWQLIARGVEDLQVKYRKGDGSWADNPGVVGCSPNCDAPTTTEYNKVIREVQVTLGARAIGNKLGGERRAANASMTSGRNAVRGQLTQISSIRAALFYLSQANPPQWK
jgi:prepilin-type N-terminal cleavage/methylation domain-containing protein